MSLLETDANGYAIPAADLLSDFLTDNDANDPAAGDPAEWPEWTDQDVWEEGLAIPPDAMLIPPEPEGLDRYLINPELAYWIAYGNCRD